MIQSRLFLLRENNFIQIENFAGCFHSLRAVLHTAWKLI